MLFKVNIIISNFIKRINLKFIECNCKFDIVAEAKVKNGFPDIDELFESIKYNLELKIKNKYENKKNDPIDIDIEYISIFNKEDSLDEPKFFNHKLANKNIYYLS